MNSWQRCERPGRLRLGRWYAPKTLLKCLPNSLVVGPRVPTACRRAKHRHPAQRCRVANFFTRRLMQADKGPVHEEHGNPARAFGGNLHPVFSARVCCHGFGCFWSAKAACCPSFFSRSADVLGRGPSLPQPDSVGTLTGWARISHLDSRGQACHPNSTPGEHHSRNP